MLPKRWRSCPGVQGKISKFQEFYWNTRSSVSHVCIKNSHKSKIFFTTSAVQQYQSQIRVYLNLCLHQQLKFDNSLSIVHAQWFVLIINFPAGHHLEMWRNCVVVPVSTLDKNSLNERATSRTATQLRYISRWRLAGTSMIKTNCLAWIIYKELSNQSTQVEETLNWD